ncbi:MAG: hypothetical protein ABI064_06090 [Acidobacteriaceae bacterium]
MEIHNANPAREDWIFALIDGTAEGWKRFCTTKEGVAIIATR